MTEFSRYMYTIANCLHLLKQQFLLILYIITNFQYIAFLLNNDNNKLSKTYIYYN